MATERGLNVFKNPTKLTFNSEILGSLRILYSLAI